MSDERLVKCPVCENMVKDKKLCPNCGADLNRKSAKSSKIMIAVAIVVVIVAIAAFASGILTHDGDDLILISQDPDNDAESSYNVTGHLSGETVKSCFSTNELTQTISKISR